MKKLLVAGVMAGLLAMSTSAFAATRAEIMDAAKAEAPAKSIMFGYKEDGPNKIECLLQDPATLLEYTIEVDKASGKVIEVEIKGATTAKSRTLVKTQAEIEKIVLEAYPDAQNLVVKLDKDDTMYEYEAKFTTPKYASVEMEINPTTGAIAKQELKLK